jgi:RNA-directed DNA polymerase
MRARLAAVREGLRRRLHPPIGEQGGWLRQVVGGFFAYRARYRPTRPPWGRSGIT